MDAWEFSEIEVARAASGRAYHEFKRVPDLSAGIYTLEAGAIDPQQPHTEDELYYVVTGRGVVTVGAEERPVVPRSARASAPPGTRSGPRFGRRGRGGQSASRR